MAYRVEVIDRVLRDLATVLQVHRNGNVGVSGVVVPRDGIIFVLIYQIRKLEKMTTIVSKDQGKEEKPPLSPWAELKVLHLDKFVTAYLFGVVLVGHGVGFIPTGVLVDTREPITLVAQIGGPQRIPHDAGPLIQHLGDRPLEALEALMKGLYQTQKR